MEYGNFYKIRFSQGGRWRRVLVHEQTLMRDFYLIVRSVMEFHNVGYLDSAWVYNDNRFRGKRLFEVFDKINCQIEIKIPLIVRVNNLDTSKVVDVLTVVEEKIKATNLNLGPLCIECETPNPDEAYSILSKINLELKKWNLNLYELLCERYPKEIIEIMAMRLDMDIPYSLSKEEFAYEMEHIIVNNPEILMNIYSYTQMVALSKLINSLELAFAHIITWEEDFDTLLIMFGVKEQLDRGSIKYFSACNSLSLLLHNYIREAADNLAFKKTCLVEEFVFGLVNLYGVIELDKAMELLRKHFVLEESNEQVFSIMMRSGRVQHRLHAASYNGEIYFCNNSINNHKLISGFTELRKKIEYKIFNKEQIFNARDFFFFYSNSYSNQIITLFDKKRGSYPKSEMFDLWCNIQNGVEIGDLVELLSNYIDFDNEALVKTFIKLILGYINSVPRWLLKGNSTYDLQDAPLYIPFSEPIMVLKFKREHQCPCGSGKKHCECCGNN